MNAIIQRLFIAGFLGSLAACSPRVEVVAPEKPLTINLNVKIEHEVKIKVEKELEDVISKDSGLF